MDKIVPALKIDIVSDVVCPWCIIGYGQLQKALKARPDQFDVSIQWHPFELNTGMPPEGQNLRDHLALKYGTSPEQSIAARTRLADLGQSLGFTFDFYDEMRMYNTFDAHQLLHWAGISGRQTALKLALFEAFFSDRRDVSDIKVLAATAAAVGLPGDEALAILKDQRFATTVRAEQELWQDRGVSAVPMFVFNGKYQVPGAQDPETFTRILDKLGATEAA